MAQKFPCQQCALELNVSDKLFDERIAGKSVSVRCKRCNSILSPVGEEQKVGRSESEPETQPPRQQACAHDAPTAPDIVVAMPIVSLGGTAAAGEIANDTFEAPLDPQVTSFQSENDGLERSELAEPSLIGRLPDAEHELTPPATILELEDLPPLDWHNLDSVAAMDDCVDAPIQRGSARRARVARAGVAAVMLAAISMMGVAAIVALVNKLGTRVAPVDVAASPADQAQPSAPAPTTRVAATAAPSTSSESTIPDYVSKPAVEYLTGLAVHRSERCHPKGHAVGTARVFFTFSPNGRVAEARVDGEPIASAPVARCILEHAYAIRIKRFDGPAFTVSLPITLR